MPDKDLDAVTELFAAIDSIKHRERQGWLDHDVPPPRDTIASHSFGAALLGRVLAAREDADADRVMRMLLVHDLVMAEVPDVTPEDDAYDDKRAMERDALKALGGQLPAPLDEELPALFEEFTAGETEAARVAQEADKLDTLLQARSYDGDVEADLFDGFLEHYGDVFTTETGTQLFAALAADHDTGRR